MWSNQKAISVVVQGKLRFKPPYCANPKCRWHSPDIAKEEAVFVRYGTRKIKRFPYTSVRFRCQRCRKTFSESFFGFSYRDQLPDTYQEIFDLRQGGWTKRRVARHFGYSLDTVLRRIRKLARQSFLIQAKKAENLEIKESIAFDGLENFAFSQFDPNNINHAIGRDSLFTYDFNFSPLNRKGRMSERQKKKKKLLENDFWPYPKDAIHSGTKRIVERLFEKCPGDLVFHSDNHYAYRDVIKNLKRKKQIDHRITPAKLTRNYRNRLFAINHMDLITRQKLTAFKRETISFSKHSVSMIEDYALLMVEKNFMRPMFEKKHVRDPSTNTDSPAMRVGIEKKILKFHEFFKLRVTKAQVKLNEDWQNFVERMDKTSRRKILSYSGI